MMGRGLSIPWYITDTTMRIQSPREQGSENPGRISTKQWGENQGSHEHPISREQCGENPGSHENPISREHCAENPGWISRKQCGENPIRLKAAAAKNPPPRTDQGCYLSCATKWRDRSLLQVCLNTKNEFLSIPIQAITQQRDEP
jgi:hypothetical protein